jgi:hypothetical protein
MHGVTTAIVAFQLLCIALPALVKRKSQFYVTLGLVFAIILLDALAHMIPSPTFGVLVYALVGFLQCASLFVLTMSVGGMTVRQLIEELAGAYEAFTHGEPKEVIVPISGNMQPKRPVVYKDVAEAVAAAKDADEDEEGRVVYSINDPSIGTPAGSPPAPPAGPPKVDRSSPLPLE